VDWAFFVLCRGFPAGIILPSSEKKIRVRLDHNCEEKGANFVPLFLSADEGKNRRSFAFLLKHINILSFPATKRGFAGT
jgi:hypothetical protein